MREFSGGWPHTTSPFHKGELAFQRKVGVADKMDQFARRVIRPYMPEQHREFFENLPMIYLGCADQNGWPIASLIYGEPGFIQSPDPEHLNIKLSSPMEEELMAVLKPGSSAGLLGLEMHTRRRNRLNVNIMGCTGGVLSLKVEQSFGNCPQYIQSREISEAPGVETRDLEIEELCGLDDEAAALIRASETFFVASLSDGAQALGTDGVDMSHRGGRPGFVKVEGNSLIIPDFTGNFHFNTLGNFWINPRAGLLFIDYETGDLLQVSGVVDFLEDAPDFKHFEGAERFWRVTFKKGRWLRGALPHRWSAGEASVNSVLTGTWQEAEDRKKAEDDKRKWRPFTVSKIVEEAANIKSFYLLPADDGGLAPFQAGQFLTLSIPASSDKPIIRTYTVSSSPLDKSYRISVKRDGIASSYLHDQISEGATLDIKAPMGAFYRNAREMRPAFLLAAGIGVTPMMSMIRDALQTGVKYRQMAPLVFSYVTHHMKSRAFHSELNELEKLSGGALKYISLLSQPEAEAKLGEDYDYAGYITTDLICEHSPAGEVDYYICGPTGFMQQTYNLLRQKGVPDDRIFAESFGPSSLKRDQDNYVASAPQMAEQATVSFAQQGVELLWTREEGTLLEFAEKHGIEPEFSCRSGTCGTCAVRLKEGRVVYSNSISTPIGDGEVLLCSAHPAKGCDKVTLEL